MNLADKILGLVSEGHKNSSIRKQLGCSQSYISVVKRRLKDRPSKPANVRPRLVSNGHKNPEIGPCQSEADSPTQPAPHEPHEDRTVIICGTPDLLARFIRERGISSIRVQA